MLFQLFSNIWPSKSPNQESEINNQETLKQLQTSEVKQASKQPTNQQKRPNQTAKVTLHPELISPSNQTLTSNSYKQKLQEFFFKKKKESNTLIKPKEIDVKEKNS